MLPTTINVYRSKIPRVRIETVAARAAALIGDVGTLGEDASVAHVGGGASVVAAFVVVVVASFGGFSFDEGIFEAFAELDPRHGDLLMVVSIEGEYRLV